MSNWRPIAGFPYEVSDQGEVRRSENGGSPIAKKGRYLKPSTDKDGYKIVALCIFGTVHYRKVHVLVCTAFNGPPPPGTQVRHLDGVPWHNTPDNLCWGTCRQNADDREIHGNTSKGEDSSGAVFTQEQVDDIRRRHAKAKIGRERVPRGWLRDEADSLGLSVHTVSYIIRYGYGSCRKRKPSSQPYA